MPFNGRFVDDLISFAEQRGAERATALDALGIRDAELRLQGSRIDNKAFSAMMHLILDRCQDKLFGLHMGESMNLSAAGLIMQIVQSSRTVREALGYVCQFANLGCSSLPMELEEAGDTARLTMVPDREWLLEEPEIIRHIGDGMLAFTLRQYKSLTHHKHLPIIAGSPFDSEIHRAEFERVLGIRVSFRRDCFELVLKRSQLDQRVNSADYGLLKVLVAYAEERLAALSKEEGFHGKVRRLVVSMAKPEPPSLDAVAANMNLSPRTLQRKLKEEGFAYSVILEKIKAQQALSHLKQGSLSISEIAYLLGYADHASFSRSFKRWTGKSPQAYRETINS